MKRHGKRYTEEQIIRILKEAEAGKSEIDALGENEIGSRRKRFKSDFEQQWATDIAIALRKQLDFVNKPGVVVIVLPHKDSGRKMGRTSLDHILKSMGWKLVFSVDRSIRQLRTRQSWTSIKKETVLIYEHG